MTGFEDRAPRLPALSQLRLLLWLRARTVLRTGLRPGTTVLVVLVLLVVATLAVLLGDLAWDTTRMIARHEGGLLPADGYRSVGVPEGALTEWVHVALFGVYLVLVLLPVLGFSGNEFYDVTRLFHLPVTHRTVFVAQTLGMMAGGTVLFFLPFLLGIVLGLPGGGALISVRLLLLLLFLFHAVALSQLLQLALLQVLCSRRFRELAAVALALLAAGIFLSVRVAAESGDVRSQLMSLLGGDASRYLALVPSSWVAAAIVPEPIVDRALALAGAFLSTTALIVLLAAALQRRAFHGEVPAARTRVRKRRSRPGRLRGPRWIPEDLRAVAGKEARLLRREPVVRTMLIQQGAFFLVPVFLVLFGGSGRGTYGTETLLLLGGISLLFVEAMLVLNLFGLEGAGTSQLLQTPISPMRILGGKLLAYGLIFAVVNLTYVALATTATGVTGGGLSAERLAAVTAESIAALLILLGLGAVVSVWLPVRLSSRSRRSLSQSRAGREGCITGLFRLMVFLVFLFLLAPAHLLCRQAVTAPLALVYAAGLLLAGLRWGALDLDRREERLVRELTASE